MIESVFIVEVGGGVGRGEGWEVGGRGGDTGEWSVGRLARNVETLGIGFWV